MSFILDALKKSETDRQQKGTAEFTGVPTSSGRRDGPPAWLWIVGMLLVVNIAVLLGILLRPDVEPTAAVPTREAPEPAAASQAVAAPVDDFAEQVEAARRSAPPREEPPAVRLPQAVQQAPSVAVDRSVANTAALPTIHEVVANGMLALPELHVDIHVFSEVPDERFVFINMTKHTEGSRLAEGPLVDEITPDGVVLSMSGTTFLLPRD